MKSVVKVHLRLALMAAEDGRYKDMTASLEAVDKITHHCYDVPSIGASVADLIELLLHRIVPKLAIRLADDKAGFTALRKFLGTVREPTPLIDLKMSVAFNLAIVDGLLDGRVLLSNLFGEEAEELDDIDFTDHYDVIRDRYLDIVLRSARAWGDHRKMMKIQEEYEEEQNEDAQDYAVLIPRLVMSQLVYSMEYRHEKEQIARARTRLTKIGLAAMEMRIENGEWPTLQQAAKLAQSSLKDPFGDKLHYVTNANSVTLYSNGRDMQDDGARPRYGPTEAYDDPIVSFTLPERELRTTAP